MWQRDKRLCQVIVVDFGGTFSHLTARKIFELGYSVRVLPATNALYDDLRESSAVCGHRQLHVVLAACKLDRDPRIDERIFDLDTRILGICNGHQLIARAFGAKVVDLVPPEIGRFRLARLPFAALNPVDPLSGLPTKFTVSMFHRQGVSHIPSGLTLLASTDRSPVAAFVSCDDRFVGLQFHPELSETEYGSTILSKFFEASLGRPSVLRRVGSNWLMSSMDSLHRIHLERRELAASRGGVSSRQ